jgi:16S rRNA processing protein RimM
MPTAGRVGRPHGLDGHFHVAEAAPELLVPDTPVVVGGTSTRIVSRKGSDDRPIVRLELAADRSAAIALRGQELVVDRAARELDEDEYWAEDLVGAAVVDGSRPLGTVTALLGLPSCEALQLDTGLIVPLVHDAIRTVDVGQRRIDVDAEFLGAA